MFKNPAAKGSDSNSATTRHFFTPVFFLALLIFPYFSAFCLDLSPQPGASTNNPEMIRNVMEMLNRSHHDSVLAVCNRLIENEPESPVGYFLASDAYQTMMRDYRVRTYQAQFDSLIKIAVVKATAQLNREPTAENHFVSGSVQGFYCLALFQAGSYLRAIKTAESSIAILKKASQLEPDFVDPLFGIAVYEYTKSKLLFGLLGGNEKAAIAKLRKVEKSGRYLSANASYSLQAIYFENEKYDSALVINDRLFRRYPSSPSCLYNRALLLEKTNRTEEALEVWSKLTGVLTALKPASNGYLAESHYHLASIHHRLKNDETARKLLIQAAQFAARRQGEEELEGSYVKFNEIKSRINTALQGWRQ
jgi:tetratricopeptide (TPR) repeat protein